MKKGMLSLWPVRKLLRIHEHQSTLSPPRLSPGYTGFRLVNSSTACAGTVEVQVLGTWGTLCASRWDLSDAHVLCRQLNCGFAESIPGEEHFGRGTGPVWRDSFHCDRTEAHLGQWTCAGLRVTLQMGTVRLEGGSWRCAGRVEVKQQGQWGTVCGGYFWDMNDTAVVCKQLGCGSALQAHKEAHFGSGSGPIWMAGVECDGTESALSECTNTEWIREYCDHRWDAGVTCSGFVQLVGGDSPCSGRVEIRDGDQWKTICDSDFGPKAATMVCRELQCGTALSVAGAAHFGEGDGPIWDRELQCVGNESFLASCPRGSPRDKSCSHTKDAGVTCTRFRLVNGSTACEGRVEVQVLGTWGKLCASHWDLLDAHVLCRHLDCGFAESIPRPGHFGRATHPFWRDSFHCDGTEGHLGQCPVTALGALCSQENDAAVICSGECCSGKMLR
uniref:SRCR domain-containing protein n=1 Tax=Aquila chrysaetos chrysaetos TaxID=223781 RepID=A0A663F0C7_AQUCH